MSPTRTGSTTRSGSSTASCRSTASSIVAELAERVGARYWGPGRYRAALRGAVGDGVARRVGRDRYGPGRATAGAAAGGEEG